MRSRVHLTNQMHAIYEAWDYHWYEKIAGADRIARLMIREMGQLGIPKSEYIPFLQQKFSEMVQTIAKEESVKVCKP